MQKLRGPVLGIETSCDETSIALYDPAAESQGGLRAHLIHSQIDQHALYGGVVPELAARDHIRRALPMVQAALREAGIAPRDLTGVAYTAGPGLIGALLVGAALGRSLAWGLGIPAIAVHHMEGHLLAARLEDAAVDFPLLALLISGGHTMLIHAHALGRYELLGQSLDDAVGEVFDKVAKSLRLPYPGGPALERLAAQGQSGRLRLPRPLCDRPGFDFSFSGLKTRALTTLAAEPQIAQIAADLALAFEEAVADTLAIKSARALAATGLRRLVVAGGVAANRRIRGALTEVAHVAGATLHLPRPGLCTDNAAMIAYAGSLRLAAGERSDLAIAAVARWPLATLTPPAGTPPAGTPPAGLSVNA